MIIVFDTNIWISELGLNSTLGAATRFFIKQKKAVVALPEVVKIETEHNLRNMLMEYIDDIRENHRKLLTIFGKLKEIVLPNDEDIDKKVAELFSDIELVFLEVPFSMESARQSLIKTIDYLPPSAKNHQQFKDGVLWSDCIELLKSNDVYLVTNDKDFYLAHDYGKGLASNLREEISKLEHSFQVFSSLQDLIQEIKTEVKLDEQLLEKTFLDTYREGIEGILKGNGFELGQRVELHYKLFATEHTSRQYLDFYLKFECKDINDNNRVNAFLLLHGDGNYNSDSRTFDNLRNFGEKLEFELDDGSKKVVQNYVLFAGGMYLGHKEVIHTVRYELFNSGK